MERNRNNDSRMENLHSRIRELEVQEKAGGWGFNVIILVLLVSLALAAAAVGVTIKEDTNISGSTNITVSETNFDPDYRITLKSELTEINSITHSGTCYLHIIGGLSVSQNIITGASTNNISGGILHSGIIGGKYNGICGKSIYSGIVGGDTNIIKDETHKSFIGGGRLNGISGKSHYSGIVGGYDNHIEEGSEICFIGGGQDNTVSGKSAFSGIIGGSLNKIYTTGNNCGILGGNGNKILDTGDASCILGGENNQISGNNYTRSVIAGGTDNEIGCCECFIGGGKGLSLPNGVSYRYSSAFGRYNNINIINSITNGACVQVPYHSLIGSSVRLIVGSGSGSGSGACANAMVVDSRGNIFLGDETHHGASIFHWNDIGTCYHFKAFTIPHPEKQEKWLVHGCLEGPESGVYYRGKDVAPTTVSLPRYASKIAKDFTVNVTPIGNPRTLGVTEVTDEGTFDVNGEGKFFWHAIGERLKLEAEPDRETVNIKRIGPYSWIE